MKNKTDLRHNAEADFRQILDTYQDKVYNQAYRMLGNREEAEEATQDIFLRIHRSLGDFRGESKLSSWIYRIAANVCISRLRKKQLKTSSLDESAEIEGRSVSELVADEGTDPDRNYAAKETAEIVRSEVRRLPPLWAQALSLHYFGGQSYEEVAEAMEIPKPTVATYISRGKKQLAKQIIALTGKEGLFF
jgi:RNA polymerase sigma-70 factor (ECF subfamily)